MPGAHELTMTRTKDKRKRRRWLKRAQRGHVWRSCIVYGPGDLTMTLEDGTTRTFKGAKITFNPEADAAQFGPGG